MCKVHHLLRACGWSIAASFAYAPGEPNAEWRLLDPDASPDKKEPVPI